MRTEIVTETTGLARLEEPWWDLWRRVPAATVFTTPAWLDTWWRVFAPGALRTVAVWDGDRLAGLAPLYLEDGLHGHRLLPLGIGISDDFDLLIAPDRPEAGPLMAAALDAMPDWDVWSAEELAPGASGLRLEAPHRWTDATAPQSACPVLPLPSAHEALSAAIPASKWRQWQRARSRTARRSSDIERIGDARVLEAGLAGLIRLHEARWATRNEPGVLADARVRHFHHLSAPRLLAAGLLRMTLLRIDASLAGVLYGFQVRGRADAYLGGFDPAFAFESPGTVLLGDAIAQAVTEGADSFHLLRGQEPYKYEWGAVDRWNSRRTFTRAP